MKHMLHRFRLFSCSTLVALTIVCAPYASTAADSIAITQKNAPQQGWLARVTGHNSAPQRLVAVDKSQQKLFLFEKHSPLKLAAQYACTTGKNDGDKFIQGDFKTPEGIYFVVANIKSGLDYEKYGSVAYTLNYPNPVDKLRKKTGYGIWIHGRGTPIAPKVTEGCVSLNNGDITILGKNLTPGTPVALANAVNFTPTPLPTDKTLINVLERKTFAWAKAWSSRSRSFFDYYNPQAYSEAQGESFKLFRSQKERLFRNLPWIDTEVRNVQALQGPGYWVTWFQQDYRAPNLSTKGVRRLYWLQDKSGDFRIVGMEWEPHLSGTLTAGINDAPIGPGETPGRQAVATLAVPSSIKPSIKPKPAPLPVKKDFSPTSEKQAPLVKKPVAPSGAAVAIATQPQRQTRKPAPFSTDGVEIFIEVWRKAWEHGSLNAYMDCYDGNAIQGDNNGVSAIRRHKIGLWNRSMPKKVRLTNVRITTNQQTVVAQMQQDYTDSKSFADRGLKTLYLEKKNNSWRIVREEWSAL